MVTLGEVCHASHQPSDAITLTSVPILVFLGLSVLELGALYVTYRRQMSDRRQTKASLNASALWGQRHNNQERRYIKPGSWSAVQSLAMCPSLLQL